ncbi:MAG: hypothetical protein Q8R30_01380 [bacterium]|nr:hypothetical protein [bacterium]MDZ4285942.1 hypothetical protein [Candidatus Sungbacteria bacterium]
MPKYISGKEYQNEHNKGQKDVAAGTSETVGRTIEDFLGGEKSRERNEAYARGRQAAKKDIARNEEMQSTPRISGYEGSSGGGSSSGGGGGFDLDSDDAVKTILLLPLCLIAGVVWLVCAIFMFIFKICDGYKIAPMVSVEEQLRTRLSRARAEYLATQAKLAHRRYTLAIIVLIIVAAPFAFVFGRTLYESAMMAIEQHNITSTTDTDKNTISIEEVRNRVATYLKQNTIYGSHVPTPMLFYLERLEKETGVSWDGYRHLGETLYQLDQRVQRLESQGQLRKGAIEVVSPNKIEVSYNFYPELNGGHYTPSRNGRGEILKSYEKAASEKIIMMEKFSEGFWHLEEIKRIPVKYPSAKKSTRR